MTGDEDTADGEIRTARTRPRARRPVPKRVAVVDLDLWYGWCTVRFRAEGDTVDLKGHWFSDCFADLIDAVADILEGRRTACVRFSRESGGGGFVDLARDGDDGLCIAVHETWHDRNVRTTAEMRSPGRSARRQNDRMDPLDVITRYYDGCSTGDVDAMRATLHPDVVHWFLAPNPGSAPVSGDEHLARYWRKVQARIGARWIVDHALCGADEAVIEWTMFWSPGGDGERIATRGAEWFTFDDGLIREIRSYYQQRDTTTELDAFDYPGRGYSSAGTEASRLHTP